jgi:membrane dipeptidase
MFLFDAHLDLSMNALEWNRDLTRELSEIRERERNLVDKPDRGKGVVSFPEMRRGNIGMCVATQIGRFVEPDSKLPGWHSQAQAWAQTQGQVAWYKAMEDAGEMIQIRDLDALNSHIALWQNASSTHELPYPVLNIWRLHITMDYVPWGLLITDPGYTLTAQIRINRYLQKAKP